MADRIVERVREEDTPRETTVIHEHEERPDRGSNTGVIVAVIILVILVLILLFGRGLFSSGGGSSSGPSVNVTPSSGSGK